MKTPVSTHPAFRGVTAGFAFLCLLALAQNAAAQDVDASEAGEIEEVVVTATATGTAIRGVAPVGAAA